MKKVVALMLPLVLLVMAFSCYDRETKRTCSIGAFYWDEQWHKAKYSPSGRLIALVGDSRKIIFNYDASDRLTDAQVYESGPDPVKKFEFVHSPDGITEVHEYLHTLSTVEYTKYDFHYSNPNQVDYYIRYEYGTYPAPTFSMRFDITYSGGNVKEVYGTSSVIHTRYTASRYDKYENPFRGLAYAVGNPAFFPVAVIANFTSLNYGIPVPGLFSKNNPLAGEYEYVGSPDEPNAQKFKYDYTGSVPHTIVWYNHQYGSTNSDTFKFKYTCDTEVEKIR